MVNLASRLVGVAKEHGVEIVLSEMTLQRSGGLVACRAAWRRDRPRQGVAGEDPHARRVNDGSGHGGMVMHLVTVALAMLLCFQVKHFVADYLSAARLGAARQGRCRQIGGYAHAGVHALGSLPAFLFAGLGAVEILAFVVVEFAIHYVIDYTKVAISRRKPAGPNTRFYWALHGADQLVHQLTYTGLIYAALAWGSAG